MKQDFLINKRTIAFSYVTQLFQYSINILVLPFILASIDSSTLGIWYVFLSVSGLATLLDFGFSSSLSRCVSYVFSGANELAKEGCLVDNNNNKINYSLLNSVLFTTKRTYSRISILMLILLVSFGTIYIIQVTKGFDYIIEWLFFAFSVVANYYYSYVNVFVRGRGLVDLSNKLVIISKATYVVIVVSLILVGCDLWALIIANFLSAFVSRQLGLFYFWDDGLRSEIEKLSLTKPADLFSVIWYNAKRSGITSITVFAYSQANVLIGGVFLSLNQVAQLGLCMQFFSIIQTMAGVSLNTYYPRICSLWVKNDKKQIRRLFLKSQVICYFVFFASSIFLLLCGDYALQLIHSKTKLPHIGILLIFVFFYFMENTHGKCAVLISTTNIIPFYKADIVACVMTISMMLIMLKIGMGLYSFPIAMCCGSLPYNSWKWPIECYKLLKDK